MPASAVPTARMRVIKSVDVSAAQAAPGVLLVLTAREVADAGFHTVAPIQPPPGRGGQKILCRSGRCWRASVCASSARRSHW